MNKELFKESVMPYFHIPAKTKLVINPIQYEPARKNRFSVETRGLGLESWMFNGFRILKNEKITLDVLVLIFNSHILHLKPGRKFSLEIELLDPVGERVELYIPNSTYIIEEVIHPEFNFGNNEIVNLCIIASPYREPKKNFLQRLKEKLSFNFFTKSSQFFIKKRGHIEE